MSDVFKSFVFFISFTFFKVTSIDFTISSEKVLLGSAGTITFRCDITETDVAHVYNIQIQRVKSTTLSGNNYDDWHRLAFMKISTNENPTLDSSIIAASKDYVAGGSWDSNTPANTYLTLSMNIEKLVCDDARRFECQLSYDNKQTTEKVIKHAAFLAYVKPRVTSLVVRKNGFIVQGMSPSNKATAEVGDELKLTCTANIGSLKRTIIRWHRTLETSQNDNFIGYQPPQGTLDEGTAISDNQCGYTRVATVKYNITAADANRDNNLAFECFVTVSGYPYEGYYTSENNPRFYTDVNYPGSKDTGNIMRTTDYPGRKDTANNMSTTDGKEISVAAGAIAAIVIGSIIAGVLIGVVFTWVVLNRKRKVKVGLKKQNQHQPKSVSRQTELNVSSPLSNTYEQLQTRTDTESRMTYDSLDTSANSSTVPDSQPQYESLEHNAEAAHTYTDLKHSR